MPMIKAGPHPREAERLAELHALLVLDTPREPGFEALTEAARRMSGYDVAVVSLIDAERQWLKACAGPLDASSTGRDVAFCAWTILGAEPLIVRDARADPRFAGNPLVTGPPFIRAYCGIPLAPSEGLPVGTLCLLHGAPRSPTPVQLALLYDLARVATDLLRQRARSEAVAVMAHEIRSSLHGVIGLARMVAAAPGLPAVAEGHAELLSGTSEHLMRVVNDALDYARIEAGRVVLEAVPYNPSAELASVLSLLKPQADAAGVGLVPEVAAGVPARVIGDAARLRQVLLNLVGNAIKFAPGGSVSVSLRAAAEGRLRFVVRDAGIGMSGPEVARLFETFGQAEASTARRFGGSGLGLVICRRLVALMGGDIAVQSEPGAGTTITFDIAAAPDAAQDRVAHDAPAPGDRPLRVLVVDDVAVVRLVTMHALLGLGHAVAAAEHGAAAVAAVARQPFDVVLMDLEMPVMNGFAATRAIRALPAPASSVRILGLTAEQSEEAAAACRDVGMDGVLWKPIRPAELGAALGF
jgi:signal transduction histidine kinase